MTNNGPSAVAAMIKAKRSDVNYPVEKRQRMNETTVQQINSRGFGEVVERPFVRIVFQNGFPKDVGVNGCRVEDVIAVAIDRITEYQAGPLACEENATALRHLKASYQALEDRIRHRQEQGVLNTLYRHETIRTEDQDHDFSATGA
jgi:hypothetical protein